MDSHYAELVKARNLRNRVFMVRNVLCGLALLGGGVLGIHGLQEARTKLEASTNPSSGGKADAIPASVVLAEAPPAAPNKPTTLANWGSKSNMRLLNSPDVASELAGRPMHPTRNPLDMLKFSRDWDIVANNVLAKTTSEVRSDPLATYVDTTDIAKSSGASAGRSYVDRFANVTELVDMTNDIPAADRAAWTEAVEMVQTATKDMVTARSAGNHADRQRAFQAARTKLGEAEAKFRAIEDGSTQPHWAYGIARQFVRSMINDFIKTNITR